MNSLLKPNLSKKELRDAKEVGIDFSVKDKQQFQMDCRDFVVQVFANLKENTPLKNRIA